MRLLFSAAFLILFWRFLPQKPKGLNGNLIISLTSYPARFSTLRLTLLSIMSQSVRPDAIVLWIAHADKALLPKNVLALQKYGLVVKYCDDLKSYKKIIPALDIYSDSFIVTADDDVYYWRRWLAELIYGYKSSESVVCHRAHVISFDENGNIKSYLDWDFDISYPITSDRVFMTGCGGVLYPPRAFHSDVIKDKIFSEICRDTDDIWLYWMVRLNGYSITKVCDRKIYNWPKSQKSALCGANVHGGNNDKNISLMIARYGKPCSAISVCK